MSRSAGMCMQNPGLRLSCTVSNLLNTLAQKRIRRVRQEKLGMALWTLRICAPQGGGATFRPKEEKVSV